MKTVASERKQFSKAFGDRKRAIVVARAKSQATSHMQRKKKVATSAPSSSKWVPLCEAQLRRLVPYGALTQEEASSMAPPGAFIWRSLGSANWQGHLPPHRRTSRSWSLYGHRESCLLVLRELWGQYLLENGLSESDCPVQGMFAAQAA